MCDFLSLVNGDICIFRYDTVKLKMFMGINVYEFAIFSLLGPYAVKQTKLVRRLA